MHGTLATARRHGLLRGVHKPLADNQRQAAKALLEPWTGLSLASGTTAVIRHNCRSAISAQTPTITTTLPVVHANSCMQLQELGASHYVCVLCRRLNAWCVVVCKHACMANIVHMLLVSRHPLSCANQRKTSNQPNHTQRTPCNKKMHANSTPET